MTTRGAGGYAAGCRAPSATTALLYFLFFRDRSFTEQHLQTNENDAGGEDLFYQSCIHCNGSFTAEVTTHNKSNRNNCGYLEIHMTGFVIIVHAQNSNWQQEHEQ